MIFFLQQKKLFERTVLDKLAEIENDENATPMPDNLVW